MSYMSKRGWRTKEPYSEHIIKEPPTTVNELRKCYHTRLEYTDGDLRMALRIGASDFEDFFQLPNKGASW